MIVDMEKDVQYTLGDKTDCYMDPTYWIPVLLESYSEGTYQWTNDANFELEEIERIKWFKSQPNTYGIQKCVGVTDVSGTYYANDVGCLQPRCSVCEIPYVHSFYLRGPGQKGVIKGIDREYSLMFELQTNSSHFVLEGQTGLSQITWDPSKKSSIVRTYDNKDIFNGDKTISINYRNDPLGRFSKLKWTFTSVSSCNIYHTFSFYIHLDKSIF